MKKTVLCLCLLFIVSTSTFSQNNLRISGKVFDAESKAVLEFVSVSIKEKGIGTVTNSDGVFEFQVENENLKDTLLVSHMGYESFAVLVQTAIGSDLVVNLTPRVILLNEVVVWSDGKDPQVILQKAFQKIEINYPTDPYVYKGFLREVWSQNDKAVSLVEGAFSINDDAYKPNRNRTVKVREKVDLKNLRASKNYMNPAFKTVAELYNSLSSALRWNQAKYPHPDIIGNLKTNQCTLEDTVYLNEDLHYVVALISEAPLINKNFERKNVFYIDSETFAIKKIEHKEYAKDGKYRNIPWPLPDSTYLYKAKDVSSVYEFENYKGKMYLKYFNENAAAHIYNTKTKSVEFVIESKVTLVVTDILTDKTMTSVENKMDHAKSLILQTTPYDPDFWKNSDQVKLVPLTSKQVKDLEWELPLEKQFADFSQVKSSKRSQER